MRVQRVRYDRRTGGIDMIGHSRELFLPYGYLRIVRPVVGWGPYTHLVEAVDDFDINGYFLATLSDAAAAAIRGDEW
jgi:hypothetical protein